MWMLTSSTFKILTTCCYCYQNKWPTSVVVATADCQRLLNFKYDNYTAQKADVAVNSTLYTAQQQCGVY